MDAIQPLKEAITAVTAATAQESNVCLGTAVSVGSDYVSVLIGQSPTPSQAVRACDVTTGNRVVILLNDTMWICIAAIGGCPYAVGDYLHTDNAIHPTTRWPGTTWVAVQGKSLYGQSPGETEFNTVGKIGGEKNVTLTASQMPSHEGHIWLGSGSNPPYEGNAYGIYLATGNMSQYGANARGWQNYNGEYLPASRNLGGGGSHNNLPPYQVTYIWKRTG